MLITYYYTNKLIQKYKSMHTHTCAQSSFRATSIARKNHLVNSKYLVMGVPTYASVLNSARALQSLYRWHKSNLIYCSITLFSTMHMLVHGSIQKLGGARLYTSIICILVNTQQYRQTRMKLPASNRQVLYLLWHQLQTHIIINQSLSLLNQIMSHLACLPAVPPRTATRSMYELCSYLGV